MDNARDFLPLDKRFPLWYHRFVGRVTDAGEWLSFLEVKMNAHTRDRIEKLGFSVLNVTAEKCRIVCPECSRSWMLTFGVSAGVVNRVLSALRVHMDGHVVKRSFVAEEVGQVSLALTGSEVKPNASRKSVSS